MEFVSTKMITCEAIRWMVTHGITNFDGKTWRCYRLMKSNGLWNMRQFWSLARNEITNALDGTEDDAEPEEKQKFKSIRTVGLMRNVIAVMKILEILWPVETPSALPFCWVCICKFNPQMCIKYILPKSAFWNLGATCSPENICNTRIVTILYIWNSSATVSMYSEQDRLPSETNMKMCVHSNCEYQDMQKIKLLKDYSMQYF